MLIHNLKAEPRQTRPLSNGSPPLTLVLLGTGSGARTRCRSTLVRLPTGREDTERQADCKWGVVGGEKNCHLWLKLQLEPKWQIADAIMKSSMNNINMFS